MSHLVELFLHFLGVSSEELLPRWDCLGLEPLLCLGSLIELTFLDIPVRLREGLRDLKLRILFLQRFQRLHDNLG